MCNFFMFEEHGPLSLSSWIHLLKSVLLYFEIMGVKRSKPPEVNHIDYIIPG